MREWRTPLALFLGSFLVYNLNFRCIWAYDTMPARLLPFALLKTGTLYLDHFYAGQDFDPQKSPRLSWMQRTARGHLASTYPVVVPLLVTPFALPAHLYAERRGLSHDRFREVAEITEKISASIIAALSVVLVQRLLARFASRETAWLLTIAYAFGSETWMIGGQALWQHGMAELLLAGILLALVASTRRSMAVAGLLCGLLFANRPADLFFSLAAAGYVAAYQRKEFVGFVFPAAIVAALLVLYDELVFGTLWGGYGAMGPLFSFDREIPLRFAGLLLSPAHGLLVFCPLFALLIAAPFVPAAPPLRRLLAWFGAAVLAELALYSTCIVWYGGFCYGPRYLTDGLPVLVLALVPVIDAVRLRPLRIAVASLVAFSVVVQGIGAFCFPSGRGIADYNQMWGELAYVVELRAGPSEPTFLRSKSRPR